MSHILNRCAELLRRFSVLNQCDPSAEVQLPVVVACLVCYISVVWLARPAVRLVGIEWIRLTFKETAAALNIAVPTAKQCWACTRAWLKVEMGGSVSHGPA